MGADLAARTIRIDRLDDPRIDEFRDVRDKDLRGRDRLFMAESEMVLARLLRTPDKLNAVFVSPNKLDRLSSELSALPPEVPIYVADVDLMTEIAGFHIHRGVLATGRRPWPRDVDLDAAIGHLRGRTTLRIVVAEGLTNVDNMGGIFRNAAAFGADAIVLDPTCCDPLYRKAIRVSMGHVLALPWAVSRNWPSDLDRLKDEWGVTLVAAETTPDAVPLWQMPRVERAAVLVGAEHDGVSPAALERCDAVVEIPMADGVPSLNVSVAAGVALYEMSRRP